LQSAGTDLRGPDIQFLRFPPKAHRLAYLGQQQNPPRIPGFEDQSGSHGLSRFPGPPLFLQELSQAEENMDPIRRLQRIRKQGFAIKNDGFIQVSLTGLRIGLPLEISPPRGVLRLLERETRLGESFLVRQENP